MKYTSRTIKKITDALKDGQGRVRACKLGGITYETFTEWMLKPEFSELVLKAEDCGNDKIKDLCKRKVIEDKSWQSAAWWLERVYPMEFRMKNEIDNNLNMTGTMPVIKFIKSGE